jgi:hypothetical protein
MLAKKTTHILTRSFNATISAEILVFVPHKSSYAESLTTGR